MKKVILSAAIFALTVMGCSDADLDNSVATTGGIEDKGFLPYFVFREDGTRLDENRVELKMNRRTLELGDNESFESLKEEYQRKILEDSAYSRNMLRPANYYCDESLLAINADYETVLSFSGDTLLSDYSLYKGCQPIVDNYVSLKRQGEELPFTNATQRHDVDIDGFHYYVIANMWDDGTGFYSKHRVLVRAYKQMLNGDVAPYAPDWIHLAIASGTCRINGNSLSCRDVFNDYKHYHYYLDVHYNFPEKTDNGVERLLSVVNFAVVFNLGQPNQIILADNVAKGYSYMTPDMLLSFYRMYIYDVYANQ